MCCLLTQQAFIHLRFNGSEKFGVTVIGTLHAIAAPPLAAVSIRRFDIPHRSTSASVRAGRGRVCSCN